MSWYETSGSDTLAPEGGKVSTNCKKRPCYNGLVGASKGMIVSITDLSKIFVCFTDSISQTSSCRVQIIVFTKKAMKYFPLSNFGKMIEIVFLFTLVVIS